MFQIAAATVQGRRHAQNLRNSQDAFALAERDGVLAAVACDGCGGAPHSEVGARLGARLVADELIRSGGDLAVAEAAFLGHLTKTAKALGEAAADYLLFTVVGAVIARGEATLFACGDGLYALDGEARALGPFEEPPYPGYALLGHAGSHGLEVLRRVPASALGSLALGTDGALDLLQDGLLGHLTKDELIYRNPDGLRRRLVQLRRQGLFADDATLIVLRRAP